ncbi:hypothetical protein, partial [Angelakisella massiliensis]|uniref:hypothetical protein n=1 Tax=Angelakisella massiliensis TaxID=1871018 RepID=UPI0024B146A1
IAAGSVRNLRRMQGVLDTPWKRAELFRHAQATPGFRRTGLAVVCFFWDAKQNQNRIFSSI